MSLSALDKQILDRLQEDLPFVKRPWKAIAGQLNIKERFLLERIASLKKSGAVRRISATFDPRKIGFASTLVAAKIAPKKIDKVAKRLNAYDEITHNYKRNSEFNLWFTLIAPGRKRINTIISQIKKDKDIDEVLELPATKIFKIKVNFQV